MKIRDDRIVNYSFNLILLGRREYPERSPSLSEHHVLGSQLSATPAVHQHFPLRSAMIRGTVFPLNRWESQEGITGAGSSPSNKAGQRQVDFILISGIFSLIPSSPGLGGTDQIGVFSA